MSDKMCKMCVLTDAVPRVTLDSEGICNVCREYEVNKLIYRSYFATEASLEVELKSAKREGTSFDVLLMYSGGKDSTYVLYRLVDLGLRVLALTFDNGYIPKGVFQ